MDNNTRLESTSILLENVFIQVTTFLNFCVHVSLKLDSTEMQMSLIIETQNLYNLCHITIPFGTSALSTLI